MVGIGFSLNENYLKEELGYTVGRKRDLLRHRLPITGKVTLHTCTLSAMTCILREPMGPE